LHHPESTVPGHRTFTARLGNVAKNTATALTAIGVAVAPALAQTGYTLPTGTETGFLQQLAAKMQELASFTSSPLGAFVVLAAFIGAAAGWVFAPKSGAMGLGMRAVSAGVVVFNITAIISYLTLGSATTPS
jgi:hypothetical protein